MFKLSLRRAVSNFPPTLTLDLEIQICLVHVLLFAGDVFSE